MSSKINWLLQNTAPGSLVAQSWLTKHDISPSLAHRHEQSNGLYVDDKAALPKGFKEFPNVDWFFLSNQKLSPLGEQYLTDIEIKGNTLKASVPELAAYELVNAVPAEIAFEHAAELFQGLLNLNPRKVEKLLNASGAVQTNRLYLFLADYYAHAWAKRIDKTSIDLGSGKRQVVSGGKLDKQYQITVPENFINGESSHG